MFGTVTDLRRRPELEGVVGYCLTPLAVRADLSGDPSFIEVLRRVRGELVRRARQPRAVRAAGRELRPRREPGANPIFQAMVVLEPPMVASDPSWSVHQMDVAVGNASGARQARPAHRAGRATRWPHRRPSHLQLGHVQRRDERASCAGHWHTLLAGIAANRMRGSPPCHCSVRRSGARCSSRVERHRGGIPERVAHPRAGPRPGGCAPRTLSRVVFEAARLTFAELDARADRRRRPLACAGRGAGETRRRLHRALARHDGGPARRPEVPAPVMCRSIPATQPRD